MPARGSCLNDGQESHSNSGQPWVPPSSASSPRHVASIGLKRMQGTAFLGAGSHEGRNADGGEFVRASLTV